MRRAFIFGLIIVLVLLFSQVMVSAESTGLIYSIPITGEIDPGLVNLVTRGLVEADEAGADLIILDVDTFGGLVDSAIKIRDLILNSRIPTISYVSGRAWSAGALITLSAEKVVMKPESSIGAAETRPKEEKYISALRKEFKATAEKRNKNADLAAAMVDADIEIKGVIPKGKLLTLTAKEAVKHNIADFTAENLAQLYSKIKIEPARIVQIEPTSTEKLARYVTRPTISGILLTLGFIAIIFEALTPGWGIGGTVALVTLGLFFSGSIINGVANWGLIILFLAGLILIALEIFVIPGFGITGLGGLIAIFISLYFFFPTAEIALGVLATVLILSVIGTAIIIRYFGGSRFWKRISLGESQTKEAGYIAQENKRELIGKTGQTITPLRPAGIVEIDGQRWDVVSEGGFIDRDEIVEVIKIAGNRIVVKETNKEV